MTRGKGYQIKFMKCGQKDNSGRGDTLTNVSRKNIIILIMERLVLEYEEYTVTVLLRDCGTL